MATATKNVSNSKTAAGAFMHRRLIMTASERVIVSDGRQRAEAVAAVRGRNSISRVVDRRQALHCPNTAAQRDVALLNARALDRGGLTRRKASNF
jgi:hypothetical protein